MIEYRKTAVTYQGDGNTSVFPFSFAVTDANSVRVSIYDKATDVSVELTRDYFVDMTANVVHYPGYAPGESVDAHAQPPKLPRGKNITIYRVTPIDQLTDLGNKYPLPYIETMADKLTAILQEHDEMLGRAVTSQKGSGITPKELIDSIFRTGEKVDAAMNAANGSAAHAAASQTAAKSSEDAAREMTEQMHTVFSNSVTEIKKALLCSMNGDTEDETKLATVGWVKQCFEKLLKSTIEASGIRVMSGHAASYVCFGNLFGNLTIQWGTLGWDVGKFYRDIVYPISYRKSCRTIVADTSFNVGENGISELDKSVHLLIDEGKSDLTKCRITSSMTDVGAFFYLSIGF